MIQINLLPYHLRPIKRTPVPYILAVLLLVVAVAAMAVLFLATQSRIQAQKAQYAQLQSDLDALADVVKQSNELVDLKQQLATKIQTIDEIVKGRILWSRQLWNLSRLAPANIWFKELKVADKTFNEKVTTIDPSTKKPTVKETPVKKSVLQVGGYVVASKDAPGDVSPLARALEQDPEFSSLFRITTTRIEDTEFEEQPVKSFSLEYLIAPQATAPPAGSAAGPAGTQGGGRS